MIKKLIYTFAAIFTLLLAEPTQAQSGWQAGQYYQYEGQRVTEWDPYYLARTPFGFERRYRILQWERQYRSGYIQVWNGWSWVSQWQTSYAWYCWWSNWYYVIR